MTKQETNGRGRIRRAASSVGNAVKRLAMKVKPGRAPAEVEETEPAPRHMARHTISTTAAAHPRLVDSDIPLETIEETYTPSQVASRASFRSDGHEREADQEYVRGVADDRFNPEDAFTNRSGDPRIGTHRRTHESAERGRDEAR